MTSVMNRDWSVLQGAFVLADKLCHPSTLSSLQKADWSRVGNPVLEGIKEVCTHSEHLPASADSVTETVVCAVWLKLLCREAGEDVETGWRENPFFPLQNSIPEVSHVVLLEVIKSTHAARIYAQLLQCLPQPQLCTELDRLVQHVKSSPTTEEDVQLFVEVWWELWRGRDEQKAADIEDLFAAQFARLSSEASGETLQAAKRLKLDPADETEPAPNNDTLRVLLHALQDIKHHFSGTHLCLQALSVCLNALYTTFLISQAVALPTREKLQILSKAVSIREKNDGKPSPELVREAHQDLQASHTPSQFRPSRMKFGEALKVVIDIAEFWQNSGFLEVSGSCYPAFQLELSVRRVLTALHRADQPEGVNTLRGLLESLTFPAAESKPELMSRVAAIIISHHLDGYQDFAGLFVSEMIWVKDWMDCLDCLEKNQAAFQQPHTLTKLTTTLMSKLQSPGTDVGQSRRLMKVTTDIFSALTLEDKNEALSEMLRLSSRGFFGCSVPSAVADGFEQELNMAFNCIIQGGSATPHSNLNTAVSLVARVAFQNPEAALRSCCHSAVFNKGAFSLMAAILQQLPGLRGQRRGKDGAQSEKREESEERMDERRDGTRRSSLLCRCLQEVMDSRSLSALEKEQFLRFVDLLMKTGMGSEGEERKESFLTPPEVVNVFVLPHLSSLANGSLGLDLSLQLLSGALSVDVQGAASSPHWVTDCSPFPLLYILAQLLSQTLRCWDEPAEGAVSHWSMDTRDLLVSVLTSVAKVMGAEVAADPSSWSRALFWLYNKMEDLDWTVRFHLKPVWGEHFKNEVPSALLTVCELPEQDWSGLDLPQYGLGTGLLAWMECCSLSDSLLSTMLAHLSLVPDHVNMFSKGLLVALTQTLPWCSVSQWNRLLRVLKELITSKRLHVPFSLEYVDYLPLLDLRRFSCELRLSILLLRVFQLLCGPSCSDWLSGDGWAHLGRLYAQAVREMMNSVRTKLPLPSSGALSVSQPLSPTAPKMCSSDRPPNESKDSLKDPRPAEDSSLDTGVETAPCQEVLFVLSQLFCHVQHIQVMMPGALSEPLFLCCLEILSYYKAVMSACPGSSSPLESENTRHFFSTITDNLENEQMKAVLHQKIAQLVSTAA
ncbi:gem-associated protein 4 [Halichoeres trimaculatus]|uniref:gem-associated protein 4 n=1 Tax=Halichoeres trimaculatus TaxID=147232 RepID=UPI003D9F2562